MDWLVTAQVGMGGWGGGYASRAAEAFAFMEMSYGMPLDTDDDGVEDAFYYATDGQGDSHRKLQMWITANLALGTVRDDALVEKIYSGAAFDRSSPHLVSVSPGAPSIMVRKGVFTANATAGTLELVLATSGDADVRATLEIAAPAGWRAPGANATFVLDADVSAADDTRLDVPFVRASA